MTATHHPLLTLLDLSKRARQAQSVAELRFMLVNDSHALAAYRQSALWLSGPGVQALSGVLQAEANTPYVQWLNQVCAHLQATQAAASPVSAADVPPELAAHWAEWLPAHALWCPLGGTPAQADGVAASVGGFILARDLPWTPHEITLLSEWVDVWHHAWQGWFKPPTWSWSHGRQVLRKVWQPAAGQAWWRQRRTWALGGAALVLLFPVHLSVLAPGELVPAHPVVIRSPLEGVLDSFHVQPNETVQKDQPLFGFDEALIQSRLAVAEQALATAETEYRQTTQQALLDPKYRNQLALLTGKIEEKRTEVDYLREQLLRSRVLAPQAGVVLLDDPTEWIGRPVAVGERILRIADPADSEVEAWLPLADAIVLQPGAPVTLYLNASPLSPVAAHLRYMAHDAVQRPDGGFAYRVRATLDAPTPHRVGLKGTAKVQGGWVPLVYWVMRRPLAWVRSTLGM